MSGWSELWLHSYRLAVLWIIRGLSRGWGGWRVGLARLLVPLDPWRYYELDRVTRGAFTGLNLDVSSPKLLTSLLQRERQGCWIGTDRCEEELDAWRRVDPALPLVVSDATRLPFPEAVFDNCLCVSVVEHIYGNGDSLSMAEMWRVLKPGGELYLTTNVALQPRDVFITRRIYGEGSAVVGERVFFERHYTPPQLAERLLQQPWELLDIEYARQRHPVVESLFFALRPVSYAFGFALRWVCPHNFAVGPSPSVLPCRGHGVVYLRLRKPASPKVGEPS